MVTGGIERLVTVRTGTQGWMMLGGVGGLRAYPELRVLIRAWAAVREDTRARAQGCRATQGAGGAGVGVRASLAGSVRRRVRHAVVPQLAAGLARCPVK